MSGLRQTYLTSQSYQELYRQSIEEPAIFWAKQAEQFVTWYQTWDSVCSGDFNFLDMQWFSGAKLNVSVNCIDRHLPDKANDVAIIWESDDAETKTFTFQALHDKVCQFANLLKQRNVKKGDRVCIYMPMIPEATFAMLACARIGAIHSVVFSGFSAKALENRIQDADCSVVITANESVRGGKHKSLKIKTDEALDNCENVHTVIVVRRTNAEVEWQDGRDIWYHEAIKDLPTTCEPEVMDADDPLSILYTSGSTGKPKGVLHTTAGYLVYVAMTHHYVFDYHPGDIYWCTADVGWITGHSYIVYGPLCNGATTLMFEGIPTYPDASRFWQVVDKHQVNIFYTAPTAIRALLAQGDEFVKSTQRTSLRLLGTVGEPINPDVWEWYHRVVGDSRCPVVDTWWQTETGGIMISPIPGAMKLKPGSASYPMFGCIAAILDEQGNEISDEGEGSLVFKTPWPGLMKTVYGDQQRFIETYFKENPGYYTTGDAARRDSEGYYWIIGRTDDVMNVSGHRLGTAEIESAIVEHPDIAEAAVVGYPHEIKGEGIYAFVTPKVGVKTTDELKQAILAHVNDAIGPIAKPDIIQWTPDLPKTRSGKIMRRILRKIANNDFDNLGDTSTLSNPEIVENICQRREG